MHCRQRNSEVHLRWYQDDDWHSKSLTKMSQGAEDGNEQDRLNLEYFRYQNKQQAKININLVLVLDASWTYFLACVMVDNIWLFRRLKTNCRYHWCCVV